MREQSKTLLNKDGVLVVRNLAVLVLGNFPVLVFFANFGEVAVRAFLEVGIHVVAVVVAWLGCRL